MLWFVVTSHVMELICIEYKLWITRNGFCGWPFAHPEVLKGDYLVHGLNYCQFLKCLQKVRLVRTEERRGGTCSSGPGSPAGRLRMENTALFSHPQGWASHFLSSLQMYGATLSLRPSRLILAAPCHVFYTIDWTLGHNALQFVK